MSLNDVKLPAFAVAQLYRSSLFEPGEPPTKPTVGEDFNKNNSLVDDTGAINWKYLGDNKKGILMIVDYSGVVHLPDDDLSFLTDILGACKLSIGDVAIINFNNYPNLSYQELINHFKSKHIFLFGVEPQAFGLPMSFPHFQLQAFANKSFLFIPALADLKNDKVLKSKLWVCLKRIFEI